MEITRAEESTILRLFRKKQAPLAYAGISWHLSDDKFNGLALDGGARVKRLRRQIKGARYEVLGEFKVNGAGYADLMEAIEEL